MREVRKKHLTLVPDPQPYTQEELTAEVSSFRSSLGAIDAPIEEWSQRRLVAHLSATVDMTEDDFELHGDDLDLCWELLCEARQTADEILPLLEEDTLHSIQHLLDSIERLNVDHGILMQMRRASN